MSKASERKKARRRKRLAVRDANRLPDGLFDEDNDEPDDVVDMVAQAIRFGERITERGWTFDEDHSADGFASWFFAPSGTELDDEDLETVTRVWFTVAADEDELEDGDFPRSVHVIFVGSGTEHDVRLSPDRFFEYVDVIEAYRIGHPRPALG